MKVLVTGSEGYIGSILMPLLEREDFDITGLDSCFYKEGLLTNNISQNYNLIQKDIREVTLEDLAGFDVVIHLAALSNDPLGKINKDLTYDINYKASVKLAKLAKKAGVSRFIFASSCSLYGHSHELLDEQSESNPQTAYGKSKIFAEKEISLLSSDNFSPTFMRNATAFGISPRMRFDIVVNNLMGFAHTINEIRMLSDGKAWRPLVHVQDICNAMIKVIKSPKKLVHNEAFNVGDNYQNYQIRDIAEKIKEFYKCEVTFNKRTEPDSRNYNVSFNKINEKLGFKCQVTLKDGIKEIQDIYTKINLNDEIFQNKYFTRLKQINYLLENKILNKDLKYIKEAHEI